MHGSRKAAAAPGSAAASSASRPDEDFDEEARKLFAAIGQSRKAGIDAGPAGDAVAGGARTRGAALGAGALSLPHGASASSSAPRLAAPASPVRTSAFDDSPAADASAAPAARSPGKARSRASAGAGAGAGADAEAHAPSAGGGALMLGSMPVPSEAVGPRYDDLNPIWRNPRTGAQVFVGNYCAAESRATLRKHGITHVVNCQQPSSKNYHEADKTVKYKRFVVASWWEARDRMTSPEAILAYFDPLFKWVLDATNVGHSVLIHCLAGAHRAGTTGVAWLMHTCNLRVDAAVMVAKRCRSIINPIGSLVDLLMLLDGALVATRGEAAMRSYDASTMGGGRR